MKKIIPAAKAVFVMLLVVSLAFAAQSKRDRLESIQSYEEARAVALAAPEPEEPDPQPQPAAPAEQPSPEAPEPEPEEEPEDPLTKLARIDLAALREVNPDVIGWIEIPGTELSYPLVQRGDNEYYLNRTWDKKRNAAGSIFMDCTSRPELDGFHTIIYGHRMNNDTMFGPLKSYRELEFWQEHPYVYIAADDGVYRYEIFAAQEADVKGIVYRLDVVANNMQKEFLQTCLKRSVIDTGVTPETDNRILTLSTCTGRGHATRWVVHAVLAQIHDRADLNIPE